MIFIKFGFNQEKSIKLVVAPLLVLLLGCSTVQSQNIKPVLVDYKSITTGAQQLNHYLPLLKNKRVALLVNQASRIGGTSLIDTLLSLNVNLVKIFSPEHGFKISKDAGEKFGAEKDISSGLSIISLYGKKKKPVAGDLQDVDVLLIDLQDVGTRFYTYISTMSLAMEACAVNRVNVVVLDRPNPNAYFIDGPVLEKKYRSFVGMHPVPVVYGMTIGEYALMVNGEGWLERGVKCNLKVIKLEGYRHNMIVKLNYAPSPNLPNWKSVYLYPSLCFFEGTVVSVGRGTEFPFQVYGYPDTAFGSFTFTPRSMPGKSKYPKWQGTLCYGKSLAAYANNFKNNMASINLSWLVEAYKKMPDSITFFNSYFEKLAGTRKLREQIIAGKSPIEIRESWKTELDKFMLIRKKYLMYK